MPIGVNIVIGRLVDIHPGLFVIDNAIDIVVANVNGLVDIGLVIHIGPVGWERGRAIDTGALSVSRIVDPRPGANALAWFGHAEEIANIAG